MNYILRLYYNNILYNYKRIIKFIYNLAIKLNRNFIYIKNEICWLFFHFLLNLRFNLL